jgi:hypothetical protein
MNERMKIKTKRIVINRPGGKKKINFFVCKNKRELQKIKIKTIK